MLYFRVCFKVQNKKHKALSTPFVLCRLFKNYFCVALLIIISNAKIGMRFCTARGSTQNNGFTMRSWRQQMRDESEKKKNKQRNV